MTDPCCLCCGDRCAWKEDGIAHPEHDCTERTACFIALVDKVREDYRLTLDLLAQDD